MFVGTAAKQCMTCLIISGTNACEEFQDTDAAMTNVIPRLANVLMQLPDSQTRSAHDVGCIVASYMHDSWPLTDSFSEPPARPTLDSMLTVSGC